MAKSTIDLDMKEEVSRILYKAAKATWKNRRGNFGEVIEVSPDFSGLRAINVGGLPHDTFMQLNFDGIGTKVEVAERMSCHDTAAFDLLAMVCDDAVVRGAEPVLVGSILDVRSLGDKDHNYLKFVRQLAKGYVLAAKAANVAIVNGEVAELGSRIHGYGEFNYNWGAGLVWFARRSKLFTGKEIQPGDYVVALREDGFRSNGLTKARSIMEKAYGSEWHNETFYEDVTIGDELLHPSRIYSAALIEMIGGVQTEGKAFVNGVAHVTGGGVPEKLARVLKPSGFGAILNNLFDPCSLMLRCQELGKVPDREAYSRWNMGQGMLVITPRPNSVYYIAEEHGIESRIAGQITLSKGIKIKSKGAYARKGDLLFRE